MTDPHRLALRLKELARERSRGLSAVRDLSRRWQALDDYMSPRALEFLIAWTRERVAFAGVDHAVFGASGGVDSSLVACILARALPGRCVGYLLPADSDPEDAADAAQLLGVLGIRAVTLELSPLVRATAALLSPTDAASALGNIKTRLRTLTLFHEATAHNALFVGTGDLDEGFVGYYSKGSGSDLSPIASLHKREVRGLLKIALEPVDAALAARLSEKPAHAGLLPGRSAEAELGVSYDQIERAVDLIIETCLLYEGGPVPLEIDLFAQRFAASGLSEAAFFKVVDLVYRARHKAVGSPVLWRRESRLSGLREFDSE